MDYTISWDPLCFTYTTYIILLDILPKVLTPGCSFIIEDWGFSIGDSLHECVIFHYNGKQDNWDKTCRRPYTKDAMKALILMVEYGITKNLDHSDSTMIPYLEALEEVHSKYPLVSYEQQKSYFINRELEKTYAKKN